MQLNLHPRDQRHSITGYDGQVIQAAGKHFSGPVVIGWQQAPQSLELPPISELTTDALGDWLDSGCELLLLGCGRQQAFPPAATLAAIQQRAIGCESMITSAACRTYNVLLSEQRRVLALLIP